MSQYCGAIPAGYEDSEEDDELDSIAMTTKNLRISLVPNITIAAGLNGEDFISNMNPDTQLWFGSFRQTWNLYKRTPMAIHSLEKVLMSDSQPLLLALKFFATCPDCINLRTKTLAYCILETICTLAKNNPSLVNTLDDNTRMVAFNFVKTCGIITVYKAVTQAYNLTHIRDRLVPKLRELLARGFYKDVAYWSIYLEVSHLFDILEIVFPLILQDKVFIAEDYLKYAKEQQLPTIRFLDSLLDKQKTVIEHCDEILYKYRYVDVKHNILCYRPISKLITRLAKTFKIDDQHLPNLNFTKTCSYMHYLYRKYMDGQMGVESFRELICDTAKTKALQLALINDVTNNGNVEEAIYWVRRFQIPAEECSRSVQDMLRYEERISHHQSQQQSHNGHKKSSSSEAKMELSSSVAAGASAVRCAGGGVGVGVGVGGQHTTSSSPPSDVPTNSSTSSSQANNKSPSKDVYLALNLPDSYILMIDTEEKFLKMLTDLEAQRILGFDSEWKPTMSSDVNVSLLQIATHQYVYLIDCLASEITEALWLRLGANVFNNLEILKLGFAISQDMKALQKSLPLGLDMQITACYLDLRELYRRLKYMQIVRFPYDCSSSGESLSSLSEVCFGKKIDKSNQCSNWANRPLRYDQMVYAALDAYCLLQMYHVFEESLQRMNLDMEKVIDEVTTAKSGYLFRMKREAMKTAAVNQAENSMGVVCGGVGGGAAGGVTKELANSDGNTICSSTVKFICDSMLFGLSRELRKLGIDCIDVTTLSTEYYINLARIEHRYILTRQPRYANFIQALPPSQCLQIPADSNVEQVLNILSYLNIVVHERNLNTRCIHCNSREFVVANREEMQIMRFGQVLNSQERSEKIEAMKCLVDKPCVLMNINKDMMRSKITYRGFPIKFQKLRPHILRCKDLFFICDHCGSCSWDGAHGINSAIQCVIVSG